jgi:hypothetical protein
MGMSFSFGLPVSQNVVLFSNVSFTVSAVGDEPLLINGSRMASP